MVLDTLGCEIVPFKARQLTYRGQSGSNAILELLPGWG